MDFSFAHDYKQKVINNKSEIKFSIALLTGFLTCLAVVYFAHFHLIPSTDRTSFDPSATCLAPPTDCWDTYSKPYYQCVEYEKDIWIRKDVMVKKGSKNCYKSIYWNLESTSFYMIAWFVLWALITERAMENCVVALFNDTLSYTALIGKMSYSKLTKIIKSHFTVNSISMVCLFRDDPLFK